MQTDLICSVPFHVLFKATYWNRGEWTSGK